MKIVQHIKEKYKSVGRSVRPVLNESGQEMLMFLSCFVKITNVCWIKKHSAHVLSLFLARSLFSQLFAAFSKFSNAKY